MLLMVISRPDPSTPPCQILLHTVDLTRMQKMEATSLASAVARVVSVLSWSIT